MSIEKHRKGGTGRIATIALAAAVLVFGAAPWGPAHAAKTYHWIGPKGVPATPPPGWTSSVPLIARANVAAGQKYAMQHCAICHTFDKNGGTLVGPNLYNVVDRLHAHVYGYPYSAEIKSMKMRPWSYEELDSFLFDPQAHAPGTHMPFAGIKDTQTRADVIAWLRTLSGHPVPLP